MPGRQDHSVRRGEGAVRGQVQPVFMGELAGIRVGIVELDGDAGMGIPEEAKRLISELLGDSTNSYPQETLALANLMR